MEEELQVEMMSNSDRNYLDPRLYDAAKRGDIHLLQEHLRPDLVENNPQQGEIAIPVAGEAGAPLQHNRSIASCLLGVTHGGDTVLHIAARFGHLEVATRICLENIFLLTRDNAKLETPLHCAAKAGRDKLVALFINLASAEASNINLGELLRKRNRDGETVLYQAVLYNHLTVVKEFLSADENQIISQLASIPNNKNISPLYLAVMLGQLAIVTSLIGSLPANVSRGAYVGPDEQTALHAAALRTGGKIRCKS